MPGDMDDQHETFRRPGILTPICVACGEIHRPTGPGMHSTCQGCGSSFKERPPCSYASMEGFLDVPSTQDGREAGHPQRTLETRTLERWIGFCFWSAVTLLALLAMIRA